MGKRKKDESPVEKPKKVRIEPPIQGILRENCPGSYLSKGGIFPRQHKGEYMCNVYSRHKYPDEKQIIRTSTVTCGFDKVVNDEVHSKFQDQVNTAVEHLSQERYIASLLANYLFIKALDSCGPGEYENLPEPNESFYGKCMSSVGGSRSCFGKEFDEFSRLTDIKRITPPKKLPLTQQRTLLSRQLDTCTSTRIKTTTTERRRAIFKYFISGAIPNPGTVDTRVYNQWKHTLAVLILEFDGSSEFLEKIRKKAMVMKNETGTGTVLRFTSNDFVVFRKVLHTTELLSGKKIGIDGEESKSVCAPTIAYIRSIYNEYVLSDYNTYCDITSDSHDLYPGKDKYSSVKRKDFVKSKWKKHKPPKEIAPLPICSTRAVFISIDAKALKSWGYKCSDDAWWFDEILQPYSTRVNIPCLRSKGNAMYARNIAGFLKALKPVRDGGSSKCPWMIGSTFLTDGVQVKLGIRTLMRDHKTFCGSENLDKSGYKLPRADRNILDLLDIGRGVYNVKSLTPITPEQIPENLSVMSIDPGQVKIINVAKAPAKLWMERNPIPLLNRCSYVSGDEYREKTLARKQEIYEVQRRLTNKAYDSSCKNLKNHKKRTSDMETFIDYCRSWAIYGKALFEETLRKNRKLARFRRFRAVQSQIDQIADKYFRKRCDGKSVILFGKACFRPQKGKASAPRKKLIRSMACRGLVLMVDESYTSANCPGCKSRMSEDRTYRTKTCKKFILGSDENCCLLNSSRQIFEMDRDNCGCVSIGLRGFGTILGQDWF